MKHAAEPIRVDALSAREKTAEELGAALRMLEGRWKLLLLFHLFGDQVRRYSDLERLVPSISQKMLAQQLRKLQADGLVSRTVYPQVPPKVEYYLTPWGQALYPALVGLLRWSEQRRTMDVAMDGGSR